jgi:diguanylate cyclase (GGDEF)-like protein
VERASDGAPQRPKIATKPSRRPSLTGHRGWLPVVFVLIVAVCAGWSIMRLNSRSYEAAQDAQTVPAQADSLRRPASVLLALATERLHATGSAGLARTPGVPPHMASFYVEVFRSLERVGAAAGERTLADAAARDLRDFAAAQDSVYGGGNASLVGARHAPASVAALRAAFAALGQRVDARARLASDVARGGTMLIMLLAALVVITAMRRFDRMRRRFTDALHVQATHDPLTGLANRRQLSSDLAATVASASDASPARLVVFDLNGFKSYNDSFGHHGGDLLLRRLSGALADVVSSFGTCYRLGGDEFCALFPDASDEEVVQRCIDALGEAGDAFSITSSHGSVLVPTEASEPDLAMQLADERMYEEKDSSRVSAGQQTRNLAVRMLGAQEPDVELHSAQVAALAGSVGHRLGLTDGECADVVRAAELHDIGKIAIPYAILHKEGPLAADEWEMMRRHSTIGANILTAAPALARVAEFVRSSHERYDGAGYPRGLSGENIPLASRIIFVCDAFDAMVSDRSYQKGMSDEAALAQLRRNAGTQFDPAVVAAFCAEHQTRQRVARDREPITLAA